MKLLRRGDHTEGVDERCEYVAEGHRCTGPSAGEMRGHSMMHKLPWGMCAEHVKPEHHPADLRDRLYPW